MADTRIRILVVGAAGDHAGLLVPLLAAQGALVRGLVRKDDQAEKVRRRGAEEVAFGDLRDETSIDAAMRDVDRVFYIAPVYPHSESQQIGRSFVAAAQRAGVKRIVFSSVIRPILTALDNHIQKVAVEEAVLNSGMDFTILNPSRLSQNLRRPWPSVLETGCFREPFSASRRVSWTDYRDVAQVAAMALIGDTLRNGSFELCGSHGLDRHEVAAIMGEVLGRRIKADEVEVDAWLSRLPLPDDGYTRQALARMYDYYDKHGLAGNPLTLRAILGREPISLRQFFGDLVAGVPTTATP